MRSLLVVALGAGVLMAGAGQAAAQTPKFELAGKGGLSIERAEDGLSGEPAAGGVSVAMRISPRWRGELELWIPQYLKDSQGNARHRDVLVTAAAIRDFGEGRIRPFLLAGLAVSRTEDILTSCLASRVPPTGGAPRSTIVSCDEPDVIEMLRETHAGTGLLAVAGAGTTIGIGRRAAVVADLRVFPAVAAVLLRPSIGISIGF